MNIAVQHDIEALIGGWEHALVNRVRPYALQQDDGTYRWVFRALDTRALRAHFAGIQTLALSSLDEAGRCRWVCLDADTPDGLAHLQHIGSALCALGMPGLMEVSRRGGHLWLFFAEAVPATLPRAVVRVILDGLVTRGELARLPEIYPDLDAAQARRLGHAVRLPLGIHRRTGRRYPLLDAAGEPLPLATPRDLAAQMAHLLAHPRITVTQLCAAAAQLGILSDGGEGGEQLRRARNGRGASRGASRGDRRTVGPAGAPGTRGALGSSPRSAIAPLSAGSTPITSSSSSSTTSTTSAVIRWVDANVSPLDLLDELCPQTEMRIAGQGFLGWCAFHDDRAPDEWGKPGTPSFYVVHNRRHGWSWRCLSSNCPFSEGPMKHSFRLLQELLGLDVRSAIGAAYARWGGELGSLEHSGGDDDDGEGREHRNDGEDGGFNE